MEFNQRIMLSLVGALIGFLFAQSFNIIKYFRRPKFRACDVGSGVLAHSWGEQVDFGFFIQNKGRNAARNVRVFISELRVAVDDKSSLEEVGMEFSELKRPIDVIPKGQYIRIILGKVTVENQYLEIPFENSKKDDDYASTIDADTKNMKVFSAKFHFYCDDQNAATVLDVHFNPVLDQEVWQTLNGEVPTMIIDVP